MTGARLMELTLVTSGQEILSTGPCQPKQGKILIQIFTSLRKINEVTFRYDNMGMMMRDLNDHFNLTDYLQLRI